MSNARQRLAAAAVVAAFAVLVGLGTWQMARRADKGALIARIEARMGAPPMALAAVIEDPDAFDYRRVVVTGRFLHGREMRLINRFRNGIAGFHLITPLVRDEGPTVLVNRGWLPRRYPVEDVAMPSGRITVTGIALVPRRPGAFIPANEPVRELWFFLDIPAMAAAQGLGTLAPVVVAADAVDGGPWEFPKGGVGRVELKDDHLHYALTWYSLALALAVIAVIACRRAPARLT